MATGATTCVHIPNGVICFDNDIGDDWLKKHRGKTPRDEVIAQVRTFGGFSVFWVTSNQGRALAAEALGKDGTIVRADGGTFPWCPYTLAKGSEPKLRNKDRKTTPRT